MFYGLSLSHPTRLPPPLSKPHSQPQPLPQQPCSPTISPSFTIQPLLPPDYIEALTLADTAFATLNSLLFNRYPPSPESQRKLTGARRKAIAAMPQESMFMFKAVDNHTGRIVGVSRWTVSVSEQGEDVEQGSSVDDEVEEILVRSVPETNKACARGFYSMAGNGRRDILGVRDQNGRVVKLVPRVELETLFVHPEEKGDGVGVASALLQWGG